MSESTPAADALPGLAAAVLAVAGAPIGGCVLAGAPGPARDSWLSLYRALCAAGEDASPPPWSRIPVSVTAERLLGGLDLGATLASGQPAYSRGLLALADGGVAELRMAERQSPATCAAICAALDAGCVRVERDGLTRSDPATFTVIALDEAREDDAPLDDGLRDRLGLTVETDGLAAPVECVYGAQDCARARSRWSHVEVDDERYSNLCATAQALGLDSPRVVLQALAAARVLAALAGASRVGDDDIATAVLLVFVMRIPGGLAALAATEAPDEAAPPDATETPPQDGPASDASAAGDTGGPRPDTVDEAARAVLPANLLATLAQLASVSTRRQAAGRAGARARARQRGRPIGHQPGLPVGGKRLDVPASLKAAAPLQRLRGRRPGETLAMRVDDLKTKVFQQRRRTTTIFIVDASGSAAMQRLAETKGAIELLLAECYVRRDQVALVSFRQTQAELLLPPTRSLVRAKRSLSALPGGGGTPLAHGLSMALDVADAVSSHGDEALLVLLTDARANVSLAGERGAPEAQDEALAVAREIRARGYQVLSIDTGRRPGRRAHALAEALGARYLPLPFADAQSVSDAVRSVAA